MDEFHEIATHTVNLLRVAAGHQKAAFDRLADLQGELTTALEKTEGMAPNKVAKLEALLTQTDASIAQAYSDIKDVHGGDLKKIANLEAKHTAKMVGGQLGVGTVSVMIPEKQLETIVDGKHVFGHSSGEWWDGHGEDLKSKFRGVVQQGILLGHDVDEMTRKVRGTKAANYEDGIMAVKRREAATLIRSAAISVANEARLRQFKEMGDVVKGIQWVATLDTRTTPICRALDGKMWRLPDYAPVGHDKVFPGPTAHWNCRSTQVAVLRSWEELSGKELPSIGDDELEARMRENAKKAGLSEDKVAKQIAATRASMDGQTKASTTFEDWLRLQSDDRIDAILGPGKAALWKTGNLTVTQMTDQSNRPLTIAQLEALIENGTPVPETLGAQFLPMVAENVKLTAKTAAELNAKATKEIDAAIEAADPETAGEPAPPDTSAETITAILASPAGQTLKAKWIKKIQAENPDMAPKDVLANATQQALMEQTAKNKASALAAAKKKLIAGEKLTAKQKEAVDGLSPEEAANFNESVNDAIALELANLAGKKKDALAKFTRAIVNGDMLDVETTDFLAANVSGEEMKAAQLLAENIVAKQAKKVELKALIIKKTGDGQQLASYEWDEVEKNLTTDEKDAAFAQGHAKAAAKTAFQAAVAGKPLGADKDDVEAAKAHLSDVEMEVIKSKIQTLKKAVYDASVADGQSADGEGGLFDSLAPETYTLLPEHTLTQLIDDGYKIGLQLKGGKEKIANELWYTAQYMPGEPTAKMENDLKILGMTPAEIADAKQGITPGTKAIESFKKHIIAGGTILDVPSDIQKAMGKLPIEATQNAFNQAMAEKAAAAKAVSAAVGDPDIYMTGDKPVINGMTAPKAWADGDHMDGKWNDPIAPPNHYLVDGNGKVIAFGVIKPKPDSVIGDVYGVDAAAANKLAATVLAKAKADGKMDGILSAPQFGFPDGSQMLMYGPKLDPNGMTIDSAIKSLPPGVGAAPVGAPSADDHSVINATTKNVKWHPATPDWLKKVNDVGEVTHYVADKNGMVTGLIEAQTINGEVDANVHTTDPAALKAAVKQLVAQAKATNAVGLSISSPGLKFTNGANFEVQMAKDLDKFFDIVESGPPPAAPKPVFSEGGQPSGVFAPGTTPNMVDSIMKSTTKWNTWMQNEKGEIKAFAKVAWDQGGLDTNIKAPDLKTAAEMAATIMKTGKAKGITSGILYSPNVQLTPDAVGGVVLYGGSGIGGKPPPTYEDTLALMEAIAAGKPAPAKGSTPPPPVVKPPRANEPKVMIFDKPDIVGYQSKATKADGKVMDPATGKTLAMVKLTQLKTGNALKAKITSSDMKAAVKMADAVLAKAKTEGNGKVTLDFVGVDPGGQTQFVALANPKSGQLSFDQASAKLKTAGTAAPSPTPAPGLAMPAATPAPSAAPKVRPIVDHPQVAIIPPTAPEQIPVNFPEKVASLKVVKKLGGSTGAELVEYQGKQFVRKAGASKDHVRSEFIADRIYQAFGVDVPQGALYEEGGKVYKLTEFRAGKEFGKLTGADKEKATTEFRRGLAVDFLLGNWDVLGAGQDNALWDGKSVIRIDNGGSLDFRAMGTPKTQAEWNGIPREIFTMRDTSTAPVVGKYANVTLHELSPALRALKPEILDNVEMPDQTRAVLRERIRHLRDIGTRADEFQRNGFRSEYTEAHASAMLDLRERRIDLNLLGDTKRSGVTITDANGRAFGHLRKQGSAAAHQAAAMVPGDVFGLKIEAAVKSFNHKMTVGKPEWNTAKMSAATDLIPDLQAMKKTGTAEQKKMATAYLDTVEQLVKKMKAAEAGTDMTAMPIFAIAKPKTKAGAAPTTVPSVSVVDELHKMLQAQGIPQSTIDLHARWNRGQGSNSWSDNTLIVKYWMSQVARKIPEDQHYWNGNNIRRSFADAKKAWDTAVAQHGQENLEKVFAAHQALMMEQLERVNVDFVDPETRTVLLVRTESAETLKANGINAPKKGDVIGLQLGATESHSQYKPTYVFGNIMTVKEVPFSRVLYNHWFEPAAGSGGSGFLGDGENEWAADTSGIPSLVASTTRTSTHPITPTRRAADWRAQGVPAYSDEYKIGKIK